MEYDIIKIRSLCDRFFDGDTTAEEEMMLRDYFAQEKDVPADLMAVKVMICGMSEAASMRYEPKAAKPKTFVRKLVWGTMAAAASVTMIIALTRRGVSENNSENNSEKAQVVDRMESLEGIKYLAYLEKFEATMVVAEMLALEMENND
jgi:hypothetical protein